MKSIVINKFGGPEVFEISDIPTPTIQKDEILVEVIAGSVNPIDWKQRKGHHRFIMGSPFPIVLGYDVSGIVINKGENVNDFNVGDRVCGVLNNRYGGGLGQYAKGSSRCFAIIPPEIDLAKAAALPLSGLTAFQGIRDVGKLRKGNKILIIGAGGGVGHFAVQIASMYGAEIYAVASKKHENFLKSLADVHFIDYTSNEILNMKQYYHIIFDVAGKYSYLKCKHMLYSCGTYITTLPRPKIIIHKLISLFARGKKVKTFLMKHNSKDLEQLLEWVKQGKLQITIDKEFKLEDIAKAHEYSEAGHIQGKILIRFTS